MQAIILAAGMGRRLGNMTKDNTKCMIQVNGVKLIDRMLTQLSSYNLSRVVIVVGYKGQNLIDYIGNRYDDRIKIEYISNPIFDKTNNIYSLALAKRQLQEDDTILLESDLIFENSFLEKIVSNPYPDLALVSKYESWMDGTMVRIDDKGNILNFIPKKAFRFEDIDLYYKTVNIYKFSRDFSINQYVPFLEAYSKVMGDNEYYEQVLRILTALDTSGMKALPTNGSWYEIDDIQDLDIAEAIFSTDEDMLQKYQRRYGGYWRFPHMLDYCYLVNPFFPTERLKDEIKANFDALLTEYPSGMSINTLLASKNYGISQDYIIVGNGAAELIKCVMEKHTIGKVGIIYPTFEEYPNRLSPDNVVKFIPSNNDFSYTIQDLESFFIDKKISFLLLINPDNPSGNYIPKEDVIKLSEWCNNRNIRLLVDESFVDFTDGYADNSLLNNSVLEKHQNLMVMKSISKSYGVPGLRLGIFATSDKNMIAEMKKEISIWNINSFAEFYLQIYEKHEKDYFHACELFVEERKRFYRELQKIEWLKVFPSQANYFLCEITSRYTSKELSCELLKRYNILIKDCSMKSAFRGKNYVRIAVRNKEDNDKLIYSFIKLTNNH